MPNTPLFRHADFDILPARGAFTPAEILTEWTDAIVFALENYAERQRVRGYTAEQINQSARLYHADSARDLTRLLPLIAGDEEAEAQAQRLEEARDALREVIG